MQIDYLNDTEEFSILFDETYEEKIRKDIKRFYQMEEHEEVVVPAWRFLNKFNDFSSYVRINGLMKKMDLSPMAKDILKKSKENTILSSIEVEESIVLTKEEIKAKLKSIGFVRELKWYQLRNVHQLIRKGSGADYSVPGSGKTTVAYALFAIRRLMEEKLKMLVVCPKNVFGSWEDENEACFSEPFTTCRLEGGARNIEAQLSGNFDIFIISYEQLRTIPHIIASFMRKNMVSIYLDECHKMKGGLRSQTGFVLLNLAHLPKYKTIMSGTPMPNSEEDLVSQHQFLHPMIKTDANLVKEQIQHLYVRTTKQEMDLPAYTIKRTQVKANKELKNLFNIVMGEELKRIKRESYSHIEMVKNIKRYAVKMIQLASNPLLLLRSTPEIITLDAFQEATKNISPKLMVAISRAYELAAEGKKVLIWSNFIDTIKLLENELSTLHPVTIYGETPVGSEEDATTREGKIKRFRKEKNCYVMIANPQAASEGISLHKECHYQIFVDRNYDARLFEQAINRTHRVGLPENQEVVVELLLLDKSIDENIDNRLDLKLLKMYDVLNDTRLIAEKRETTEDIEYESSYEAISGMDKSDAKSLLNELLFSNEM